MQEIGEQEDSLYQRQIQLLLSDDNCDSNILNMYWDEFLKPYTAEQQENKQCLHVTIIVLKSGVIVSK